MGETDSHIERNGQSKRGRRLARVNDTERGIHRRPLEGGPVGEGPAYQIVAARRVDVIAQFSLVEILGEDRVVKIRKERHNFSS